MYNTEPWSDFDHFIKVLMNHFGFYRVERSLLRAAFFNIFRCMCDETIFYIAFGDITPQEILIKRILLIITFTVIVELTVSKRAAARNAQEWSALVIFYVTSFALLFTSALTRVEVELDGHLGWMLFVAFGLIVAYLQADMLEDLLLGGLNRWGGIWHNWPFYMPAFTVILSGYLINHFHVFEGDKHGAWRHPHVPFYDYMYKTGKIPL